MSLSMNTCTRQCTAVYADDMLLSGIYKAAPYLRPKSVSFLGAPPPLPHTVLMSGSQTKPFWCAGSFVLLSCCVSDSSMHLLPISAPLLQIKRDKNHPSIIVWSCGNESGFGKAHTDMAKFYRQLDPSRPTHYEVQWPLMQSSALVCTPLHSMPKFCC